MTLSTAPNSISQAQLARLAGVSRPTVSRALANDSRISPAVTARIHKLARKHNYRPNAAARSIVTQRNNAIGFVLCDRTLGGVGYGRLAAAVEQWCRRSGIHLHLSLCNSSEMADEDLPPIFREVGVDGVVITGAVSELLLQRLTKWRMPFVLLGSQPGTEGVHQVTGDPRRAGRMMMEHLLRLGHRRIGAMVGPLSRPVHASYLGGFTDAWREAGYDAEELSQRVEICANVDVIPPIQKLMQRHPDLTAIFADTDRVAWEVVQYFRAVGVDVPGEISIAGAGGNSALMELPIELTSVDANLDDMAQAAASLLMDVIGNPQSNTRRIIIEPAVNQGSTANSPNG